MYFWARARFNGPRDLSDFHSTVNNEESREWHTYVCLCICCRTVDVCWINMCECRGICHSDVGADWTVVRVICLRFCAINS